MRTKEELTDIVSNVLRDMRHSANLSKAAMASRLGIDKRTYARYESGESAPTLAGFIAMLDEIDAPVLPIIKRYLYPELYSSDSVPALRARLMDYISSLASDTEIEQLYFILEGAHGSPHTAQLQLFSAFDHMPMEARLIMAKLCINLWELEAIHGGIQNTGTAMPDMDLLRNSIIKATLAIADGKTTYTASLH